MITYLDENEFIKRKRALAKYFRKAYKYLLFEVIPKLKEPNKKDGLYEIEIPTEELFEKVYGKIMLRFSVRNDIAIIEELTPGDILIACFMKDLPTYKGIPYNTKQDLEKLKIMEVILNGN